MVGFDPDQRRCQLEKDLRKFSMELNSFPLEFSKFQQFKTQFGNTITSLESNFRGLLVIRMKWYSELKAIMEQSESVLASNDVVETRNKQFLHQSCNTQESVMQLMHTLFSSQAPRTDQTLDETLVMNSRDFKRTFLSSVWRELVRVCATLREAEHPPKASQLAQEVLADSRTMVKDLFRYFKDIYPIVMSDTISKTEYNMLHDQYKQLNAELDEIEEFLKLQISNVGSNEKDLMVGQINNQLRDVLHNTLHVQEDNCRQICKNILQLKLFNEISDQNFEKQEVDAMENFNEQILECDQESLLNELRFQQSVRSLGEDLEVRLQNQLNCIQNKNTKQVDINMSLQEIVEIIHTLYTDQTRGMGLNTNEWLEKLQANQGTLNALVRSKNTSGVSLYLSLSNCIINIKKFLDRVLKEESVLKVKCKHVEERDRLLLASENKENLGADKEKQHSNPPSIDIRSPNTNLQNGRVFERKSVNKQFDKAEHPKPEEDGSTPSEQPKGEKITEQSASQLNQNKGNLPTSEVLGVNQVKSKERMFERREQSTSREGEKEDKNQSMLPELRTKKEVKIEPYIFSRSNNAWKAITPFKFLQVPFSNLNVFLDELNRNFTHLFNKQNPSRNGEIKCKVRKLNYENSNVFTEIYSLSSFESAISHSILHNNVMKVRVELTQNQ